MLQSFSDEAARTLPSLSDVAYSELREAILSCRLPPGSVLRQDLISRQLGTSRLPVREALRRLEVEGLVVLRPRRGYVVAAINRSEIIDVFDVRAVLEGRAGYLATTLRTSDDIAAVRDLLEKAENALEQINVDPGLFSRLNGAFHDRLFAPAQRAHLDRMLRVIRAAGERYTRMSVGMSEDLGPSAVEHRQIFNAYEAGNAHEVSRLCSEHCTTTAARLLANLELSGLIGL